MTGMFSFIARTSLVQGARMRRIVLSLDPGRGRPEIVGLQPVWWYAEKVPITIIIIVWWTGQKIAYIR